MCKKKKAIPVPAEHGAWAILYGSVLISVLAAQSVNLRWMLLIFSVTGLFLAHSPFSKLLRSSDRTHPETKRHWMNWLLIDLALSLIPGLVLVFYFRLWLLIPIGIGTVSLLCIHLYWASKRQERNLNGEILGVAALTSAGFASHYVTTGHLTTTAWLIWLLSALYFTSGVFYVRMRISRFMKKDQFQARRLSCLLYHLLMTGLLVCLAVTQLIPGLLPLAYIPILARALWYAWFPEKKLNIKRIGYSEVVQTVLFLILFAFLWTSS